MAEKPTILMLASSRSVHTWRWATGLKSRGWDIRLLTADAGEAHPYATIPIHRLKYSGKTGFLWSAPQLKALCKELRPGLIHAFYATNYGLLGAIAGFKPMLLSVMGTDVFSYPDKSRLHAAYTSFILKKYGHIAATSSIMCSRVETFGINPEHITCTPFGIDTKKFSPPAQRQAEPKGDAFRIVSFRHLEQKYGLDVLIEAAARLRRELPEQKLRLDLYGEGSQQTALRELADRHALQEIVNLPGAVRPDKIPELLRQADVAVVPSREESFGVAALEAAACGIPVIGSRAGGLPEVIAENETGLLFPSGDALALKACLHKLATEPALRHQMGLAGRRFVAEHYSEEICLDRMESLYTKLIS